MGVMWKIKRSRKSFSGLKFSWKRFLFSLRKWLQNGNEKENSNIAYHHAKIAEAFNKLLQKQRFTVHSSVDQR